MSQTGTVTPFITLKHFFFVIVRTELIKHKKINDVLRFINLYNIVFKMIF